MAPVQENTHHLSEIAREALAAQGSAKDADRDKKATEAGADSDNSSSQPAQLGKRKRTAPPSQAAKTESEGNSDGSCKNDSATRSTIEVIDVADNSSSAEDNDTEDDAAGEDAAKENADDHGSDDSGAMGDDENDAEDESEDMNEPQFSQSVNTTRHPLPVGNSRRIPGGSRYETRDLDLDPRIKPGMNIIDFNRSLMSSSASHPPSGVSTNVGNMGSFPPAPMGMSFPMAHVASTASAASAPGSSQATDAGSRSSRKAPQAWPLAETKRLMDLHNSKTPWKEIEQAFPDRHRRDLQKKVTRERARIKKAEAAAASGSKGKAPATEGPDEDPEDDLDGELDDEVEGDLDDDIYDA